MLSTLLAMLETEEDRERFLKLHGAYEKKLYAVAARVLGDRTAAEDAVQQTWLQIIRRWDRVSQLPWSETEGYLVTAVKNTAVDMLRRERREEALPEGWTLNSASDLGSSAEKQYRCGESWVRFICSYPDEGTIGWGVGDPESGESRREVTVNGYTAELYGDEQSAMLAWQDEDGMLFYFTSAHVDPDALVEMAASAAPEETELPFYDPTWLPEGYWLDETTGGGGAALESIWISADGNDSLTLLCSATPLTLPEEEAEDVEVHGNAAQFWAAEEPHEDADRQITVGGETVEGNTVEVGGVTITVGSVAGSQSTDAGTLAWQNSEGIYFRLHGTESMGTLLRVAASITEATEEQNTTDSFGG